MDVCGDPDSTLSAADVWHDIQLLGRCIITNSGMQKTHCKLVLTGLYV